MDDVKISQIEIECKDGKTYRFYDLTHREEMNYTTFLIRDNDGDLHVFPLFNVIRIYVEKREEADND